jgi:hypothetical protein
LKNLVFPKSSFDQTHSWVVPLKTASKSG